MAALPVGCATVSVACTRVLVAAGVSVTTGPVLALALMTPAMTARMKVVMVAEKNRELFFITINLR
jgi:hypothetical protein